MKWTSREGGRGTDRLERQARRGGRVGRRILRGTAALPALFTIFNGLAGFGAIHFATKDGIGQSSVLNLSISAWLIVAAMVCDMLDGRLARFARKTTDFGAQLDSLSDVISFGLAPAVLMLHLVITELRDDVGRLQSIPAFPMLERVMWCIAAVYVSCALLRLARFNVESEPDESAHMVFTGLPTPGAAAMIVVLVLFFADLHGRGWQGGDWILAAVTVSLPVCTVLAALLMVSTFNYRHVVNYYIRGKRPFNYLVKLTVIAVAGFLWPYATGVVVVLCYVLSGPVRALWQLLKRTRQPAGEGGANPLA